MAFTSSCCGLKRKKVRGDPEKIAQSDSIASRNNSLKHYSYKTSAPLPRNIAVTPSSTRDATIRSKPYPLAPGETSNPAKHIQDIPAQITPIPEIQTEKTPVQDAPVPDVLVQDILVPNHPIQQTSVQDAPVFDASKQEIQAQQAPVHESQPNKSQLQDTLVQEPQSPEIPLKDTPSQEIQIEEIQVKAVSVEEARSQDVQQQESQLHETSAQETSVSDVQAPEIQVPETTVQQNQIVVPRPSLLGRNDTTASRLSALVVGLNLAGQLQQNQSQHSSAPAPTAESQERNEDQWQRDWEAWIRNEARNLPQKQAEFDVRQGSFVQITRTSAWKFYGLDSKTLNATIPGRAFRNDKGPGIASEHKEVRKVAYLKTAYLAGLHTRFPQDQLYEQGRELFNARHFERLAAAEKAGEIFPPLSVFERNNSKKNFGSGKSTQFRWINTGTNTSFHDELPGRKLSIHDEVD